MLIDLFFSIWELPSLLSNIAHLPKNIFKNKASVFEDNIKNIILKYNLPVIHYLYFKTDEETICDRSRIILVFQREPNSNELEYNIAFDKKNQSWFNRTQNEEFICSKIISNADLQVLTDSVLSEFKKSKKFNGPNYSVTKNINDRKVVATSDIL